MKVIVSFQTQLDTRAVEKTQSDERLKQDIQHLMVQVHHKFVEVDTAVATISSKRTASSQIASQAAPQAVPRFVPQTAPSATAQPSQDPWSAGAAVSPMTTQSRKEECRPRKVKHRGFRHKRDVTQVQCGPTRWTDHWNLDLEMKPEGSVAWRDRAFGDFAAERPDIRKLLLWAESLDPYDRGD